MPMQQTHPMQLQVCRSSELAAEVPEQMTAASKNPASAAAAAAFASPLSYITAAQFCGDLLHNIYQQQHDGLLRAGGGGGGGPGSGGPNAMTEAILAALGVMLRAHLNHQDGMGQSMPVHLSFFRSLLWSLEQMHPWVIGGGGGGESTQQARPSPTSASEPVSEEQIRLYDKLYDTAMLAFDLRPSSAALVGNLEKSHTHAARILMMAGEGDGRGLEFYIIQCVIFCKHD